jgi:radical SAM superfamily enzyme YgiQ (UPF0313 family)
MLSQGNIPVRTGQRDDDDPIVIVGGPAASANPEPYVDFIDVFVIGEGDFVIQDIIDIVRDADSRKDAIVKLAEVEGLYVPRMGQKKVNRLIVDELDSLFHPTAQIIPDVDENSSLAPVFGKALLVEVARGCGHACKFCLVGHICRPRRVRSLNKLKAIIERGLVDTSVNKISLIASSLGDMDRLEDLAEWIVDQDLELSVPSLRADSVTEELLGSLTRGGQRTLTIAPETGSEGLRRSTGKGLKDSAIENAVVLASKSGYKSAKLYFIVGLPEETEEDVRAIATMTRHLADTSGLKVTANVNPFIPKAHTKWERQPQPSLEILRKKMKTIEKELKSGKRVQLESLDPRRARIQASLSMGDCEMGRVIEIAAQYGGLSGWRRAEKESGIPFFSVANSEDRLSGALPWSFIIN